MVNKSKPKKKKGQLYCKRCGVEINGKLNIQLTPSRLIEVCTQCFNWSLGQTMAEVRKDYKERSRRKVNG